ncbi:hypothetical protein LOAG_15953, partial [Loa loa]
TKYSTELEAVKAAFCNNKESGREQEVKKYCDYNILTVPTMQILQNKDDNKNF